jgi:ubiquinone/menaquinone biosynthesis C-methylase UbiE
MARDTETEVMERFRAWYGMAERGVLVDVERAVVGADYGANGYTTREQVDAMLARLDLRPGDVVLDLGTGSGWPGLHVARETGCSVVGTDVPVEGLLAGGRRALADGLAGQAHFVAASADALPFRTSAFDVVVHTDVLC